MTCLAGWMTTMALLAVIGAVIVWREHRSLIAMIDDEGETFQLSREPERAERREVSVEPERRQKVLFSGLDCLPGQLDLFETDGTDTGPQPEDEMMKREFVRMALCSDGVIRAIYTGNVICVDGEYHRKGWRGITW